MTDTTPTTTEIADALDQLSKHISVMRDIYPAAYGTVRGLIDDATGDADLVERVRQARAVFSAVPRLRERLVARETAAKQPGAAETRDKINAGLLDWWFTVADENMRFECGLCVHSERAHVNARRAARSHIILEHLDEARRQLVGDRVDDETMSQLTTVEAERTTRGQECPHGFWLHGPGSGTCPEGCVTPSPRPRPDPDPRLRPEPHPNRARDPLPICASGREHTTEHHAKVCAGHSGPDPDPVLDPLRPA